MEDKQIKDSRNIVICKVIDLMMNLLLAIEFILIIELHFITPFFPILFLFNFCFWIVYPLFLRYVLKKKWFECTKDDYLKIKYILLPWLIMGLMVLLYYHEATFLIIKTMLEDSN